MRPHLRGRSTSPGVTVLVTATVVSILLFIFARSMFGGVHSPDQILELQNVQERTQFEVRQLTEQVARFEQAILELKKGKAGSSPVSVDSNLNKDESEKTKEGSSPFLYQVKDTRPLTVKTPLTPNENLWLFPADERRILPGDLKGPWYSQHGQDKMLYTGLFRNHFKGTFIELGAGDGTFLSNTRFFQESMGWSGVLIEPSDDFNKLRDGISGNKYRGKRCKPDGAAQCYHMAACRREGTIKMIRPATGIDPTVSGAVDFLTEEHVKHFRLDKDSTFEIPCRPFGVILNDANIKHVDFLSLDVEGAEETVLETMDWSIPIHVIVIEADIENSPTGPAGHERKHRILLENGFQYVNKIGFDEWWVNPKNSRIKTTTH